MASPIKGLAAMVAKKGTGLAKPAPKEEADDDYGAGLEDAMGALISAVKSGDKAGAAAAFKDAMALCE